MNTFKYETYQNWLSILGSLSFILGMVILVGGLVGLSVPLILRSIGCFALSAALYLIWLGLDKLIDRDIARWVQRD